MPVTNLTLWKSTFLRQPYQFRRLLLRCVSDEFGDQHVFNDAGKELTCDDPNYAATRLMIVSHFARNMAQLSNRKVWTEEASYREN
jgi:hypothetical protein